MLKDTFAYALRGLTRRRLRSWLTIIGIFIGIAAVVSLISLGEGLEEAVTNTFSTLGTTSITIQPRGGGFGPPGLGSAVTLDESDLRVVQRAAHVNGAAGRLLELAEAEFNRETETGFLATLPEEREERSIVEQFQDPVPTQGRLLQASDTGKIQVGANVAEESTFGRAIVVGNKIRINGEAFEVIGVTEKKGNPAADSSIVINEEDARRILDEPTKYSLIVAAAVDEESVALAKEAIIKDLRKHRDVDEREEDFTVETNEDALRTLGNILDIITGVLVGIAAISLFVGGVGIMNTMYTSVVERKKEIGIMKAIGATPGQIKLQFLIESGLLGLVGGVIGVLLGVGFAQLVEIGGVVALGPSILQASSPMWLLLGSLAFSFVVGAISGVLPANKAAQLPPVEALK